MYNVDKYFDFDYEKKSEVKSKKKKKQQQQTILLLLLVAGATYYYFMVFLPEEERKAWEEKIQVDLDKVKKLEKNDYENTAKLLNACQKYLELSNGTKSQQTALKNKEDELNNAIQWLKQNQITPEKMELEAFKKGRIWELPVKSWADVEVRKMASVLLGKYQEEVKTFPGGDKNDKFCFTRGASYNIYFPPDLKEHYEAGKKVNQTNCFVLEDKEDLILSDEINAWIRKVVADPVRMTPLSKRDNNAIFYGAPGTGKTATLKNICIEANRYPLVEIKGSALTPRDKDQKAGILVLEKFCYTISELEWKLAKTYGLERESNGEVRYILFVDEADQISNNSLIHEPNKLRFLKECLEGVGKNQRSNNLWVFATNHLKDIEEAVYRKGRLSNPLDFSWTWGEFRKYFNDFVSNPQKYDTNFYYNVPPLPSRWCDEAVLKPEDDKYVKRFNIDTFKKDFFGEDDDNPSKPKFWNLFISNNPDAIKKEEIMKVDEEGNETNELLRVEENEIEVGEFLQFFWNLKDGGQLMNYDGSFENPRTPKVEEVLDDSLPDVADLLLQSSNNLNKSLENVRQEIEKIRAEIECARINQDSSVNDNINELFKLVGELRGKIE